MKTSNLFASLTLAIGLFSSSQSFAAEIIFPTVFLPTYTVITLAKWTETGHFSTEMKPLFQAAKEDALTFIQTDGQSPKSVVLSQALSELRRAVDVTGLSEVEMAKVAYELGAQ